jgi:pimeloyl-ACP methyl ester carboxylesterase
MPNTEIKSHSSGWNWRIIGNEQQEKIMLLPGFAEDASIWFDLSIYLSRNYAIILPEYPGKQDKPYDVSRLSSLEMMALDLYEIIQQENWNQIHLFGHSMGGYLALAFLELYPNLVKSFGLIHSTATADDLTKKKLRTRVMEHLETEEPIRILQNSIPALFAKPETHLKEIQQLVNIGSSYRNEALIAFYRSMRDRPDRKHVLKGRRPILLIAGKQDKAVDYKLLIEQSNYPDCCHLHLLDSVGHMGMYESKDQLNNILERFISFQATQKTG